jgi:hypothetical protein
MPFIIYRRCSSGVDYYFFEKIFEKGIDFFVALWYNNSTEWGEKSTPYGRKGE